MALVRKYLFRFVFVGWVYIRPRILLEVAKSKQAQAETEEALPCFLFWTETVIHNPKSEVYNIYVYIASPNPGQPVTRSWLSRRRFASALKIISFIYFFTALLCSLTTLFYSLTTFLLLSYTLF